jgi:hypothetical protein
MKKLISPLIFIVAVALPYSCKGPDPIPIETRSLTHKTTEYEGALAHAWMDLGAQMIKENYLYGPNAARIYGYLGLTIWEAVYSGIPGAKSLATQINDYNQAVSLDLTKEYDWGIVLSSAMRIVLPEVMDKLTNAQRSQVGVLADLQVSQMMEKGLKESVRDDSKDLGARIGLIIAVRINKDGRDIIRNIIPTVPLRDDTHHWYFDKNANPNQEPVEPLWGTVRTFVVDNSQSCEIDPPLPYSEETGSDFYKGALEIYSEQGTDDNKRIMYHWEDGPGRTASPAGHWLNITEQLLQKDNKNLAESAKAYALVGLTAADAFSVSWYLKYKYYLLRPATYIQDVIDPAWKPFIYTPPYPDYISSSATIGGAIPVVLASLFGDIPFTDRTHLGSALYTPSNPPPNAPYILPERAFMSFTKAGEEEALSRILGGVDFRRSCDLGLTSGRCVGNTVLARISLGY